MGEREGRLERKNWDREVKYLRAKGEKEGKCRKNLREERKGKLSEKETNGEKMEKGKKK